MKRFEEVTATVCAAGLPQHSRGGTTTTTTTTCPPLAHLPTNLSPPRDIMGASCIVREDLCGCATCASYAGGALAGVLRCLSSLYTRLHNQADSHEPPTYETFHC